MKKILFIAFCVLIAYGQQKTLKKIQADGEISSKTSLGTPNTLKIRNHTPLSLIRVLSLRQNIQSRTNFITFNLDTIPDNWVKREYIDSLIPFVKSKERCFCLLNPYSSYIPNDSAELGGYVIKLIRSYKDKEKINFGLYSCPKADEREADELLKWWAVERKRNGGKKKE
jgi:hypothetical protein